MPVYEYRCQKCQKVFEYQQRMADAAKTECEECHGALERLISRSSFSFKGGGWYKDLYSSSAPSTESGSSETKSETKTETKSETKTETKTESGTGTGTGTGTGSGGTGSSGSGSAGSSSTAAAAPAK
jgi:putative FmdB family regulatory protein